MDNNDIKGTYEDVDFNNLQCWGYNEIKEKLDNSDLVVDKKCGYYSFTGGATKEE